MNKGELDKSLKEILQQIQGLSEEKQQEISDDFAALVNAHIVAQAAEAALKAALEAVEAFFKHLQLNEKQFEALLQLVNNSPLLPSDKTFQLSGLINSLVSKLYCDDYETNLADAILNYITSSTASSSASTAISSASTASSSASTDDPQTPRPSAVVEPSTPPFASAAPTTPDAPRPTKKPKAFTEKLPPLPPRLQILVNGAMTEEEIMRNLHSLNNLPQETLPNISGAFNKLLHSLGGESNQEQINAAVENLYTLITQSSSSFSLSYLQDLVVALFHIADAINPRSMTDVINAAQLQGMRDIPNPVQAHINSYLHQPFNFHFFIQHLTTNNYSGNFVEHVANAVAAATAPAAAPDPLGDWLSANFAAFPNPLGWPTNFFAAPPAPAAAPDPLGDLGSAANFVDHHPAPTTARAGRLRLLPKHFIEASLSILHPEANNNGRPGSSTDGVLTHDQVGSPGGSVSTGAGDLDSVSTAAGGSVASTAAGDSVSTAAGDSVSTGTSNPSTVPSDPSAEASSAAAGRQ